MQKILKWFAPLLAGSVAIFIVLFLISINSDKTYITTQPLQLDENLTDTQREDGWLSHFSNSQRLGYFYPVNEVFVKFDLNEKIVKVITYKLSAKLLDPYQLFCLKEELKRHKLKYFLLKEKNAVNLLIYSRDVNRLNSLVTVLKDYQIAASVAPHKEDY